MSSRQLAMVPWAVDLRLRLHFQLSEARSSLNALGPLSPQASGQGLASRQQKPDDVVSKRMPKCFKMFQAFTACVLLVWGAKWHLLACLHLRVNLTIPCDQMSPCLLVISMMSHCFACYPVKTSHRNRKAVKKPRKMIRKLGIFVWIHRIPCRQRPRKQSQALSPKRIEHRRCICPEIVKHKLKNSERFPAIPAPKALRYLIFPDLKGSPLLGTCRRT